MKRHLLSIGFFIILFLSKESTSEASVPNWFIEMVKEATKANEVKSGMGEIVLNFRGTEYWKVMEKRNSQERYSKGERVERAFFAFENTKIRFDRSYTLEFMKEGKVIENIIVYKQEAFDGEKARIMNLSRRQGEIPIPRGRITSQPYIPDEFDPRKWGKIFNHSLYNLLNGKVYCKNQYKEKKVELIGKEKIKGVECYLVKAYFDIYFKPYSGTRRSFQLWIDPEKNFQITRIEKIVPNPNAELPFLKKVKFLINIEYKNYGNGIWFPKKRILNAYVFDEQTGKYKLYYTQISAVSEDFKINVDVPDKLFQINFVEGQKVYDARIGKSIIWSGE